MDEYSVGEYIIYRNGEKYELGRIKSLREDGAFVAYHEGETGALTPYSHIHKLVNRYCIKDTTLGGDFFKADTPQTEAQEKWETPPKFEPPTVNTTCVSVIGVRSEDVPKQTDCPWK